MYVYKNIKSAVTIDIEYIKPHEGEGNIMNHYQADRETIAEMCDLIEQERQKPANQRDYELIAQLSSAIYEATSNESLDEIAQRNIAMLSEISSKKTSFVYRGRLARRFIVLASCLLLCIGLNTWTLYAFGMGLPKTIYQITKGAISFRPSDLEPNAINLPVSEEDPYGIQAECRKQGFSPLTPAYLPDDMILSILRSNGADAKIKRVDFTYRSSKDSEKTLSLDYTFSEDAQLYNKFDYGFPTDHYNITEEKFNGKNVLISWEDEVFHAAFCDNDKQIIYHITSNHIGYDETYRILCSFFE